MAEFHEGEIVDALPVPSSGGVVALQHKAELEAMVDTAHKYPRNIRKFEAEAVTMATLDQETAQDMFYVLRRGGSVIEGPSVRLAEIIATAWGNLRFGSKVTDVGDKMLTAEGFCFDCEKNTGVTTQVSRRITKRDGSRYDEDMIAVTGNAACSIALRNAISKIVPRAYIEKVYRKAKEVAVGSSKPMEVRRQEAVTAIGKLGVDVERMLAAIGRPSVKDITIDDIATLVGLHGAVRQGEQTVEEAFPPLEAETTDAKADKPKGTAAGVREKLNKTKLSTEPAPDEDPTWSCGTCAKPKTGDPHSHTKGPNGEMVLFCSDECDGEWKATK